MNEHNRHSATIIERIPLDLPHREILLRLGYRPGRTRMTGPQQDRIEALIHEGFALCEARAAALRVEIIERNANGVLLEGGTAIESAALSSMLVDSASVMLLAATVGHAPGEAARKAIAEGDAGAALVFDAVGSESADAALEWAHRYAARSLAGRTEIVTQRRFSPGYGDLDLRYQKVIAEMMGLGAIGIEITPRFQLVPEKSVIGIAGITGGAL